MNKQNGRQQINELVAMTPCFYKCVIKTPTLLSFNYFWTDHVWKAVQNLMNPFAENRGVNASLANEEERIKM